MRITTRIVIAALAALSVIALFAGPASASRGISISPSTGLITLASNGSWTFGRGLFSVICARVTLKISLATSQISKAAAGRLPEGLAGWITEGTIAECRDAIGGAASSVALTTLAQREKWFPLLYNGFLGTLPNINGVLLLALRSNFSVTTGPAGTCLYEGTIGNLIVFNGSLQSVSNSFLTNSERLISGGEGCPATGSLSGRGTISPTLTIRLI
jgi:hypothetical protein